MTDLTSERLCWDCFFMAQVDLSSRMSTCRTRHYGGLLTRDRRIVAQGFNGNLPGHRHCDEGGCERCRLRVEEGMESGVDLSTCTCVHVEQNIISYCAREGIPTRGTTLWLPANPCVDCMRLVVSAGVVEIVWPEGGDYPSSLDAVWDIAAWSIVTMRHSFCECDPF